MALDEPRDNDKVQQEEGFRLVVEEELLKSSGGLTMEYSDGFFRKGFQIKSKKAGAFGC